MGGGIRNKVRRTKFVKHVSVDAPAPAAAVAVVDGLGKPFEDLSLLPKTSTASSDQPSGDGKSIPCLPRLGTASTSKEVSPTLF